jgi:hypothetical protein
MGNARSFSIAGLDHASGTPYSSYLNAAELAEKQSFENRHPKETLRTSGNPNCVPRRQPLEAAMLSEDHQGGFVLVALFESLIPVATVR